MRTGWGAPSVLQTPSPTQAGSGLLPFSLPGGPQLWGGLAWPLRPLPCPLPCAPVTCTRLYAADIVFLLDGSSSIGRSNFREVRGFLEGLVMPFSGAASAQGVRFAAVQYSDDPR